MLLKSTFLRYVLLLLLYNCVEQSAVAQCTGVINSFPYDQDFEASDGNWVASSSTHWEWGQIISKPVITAAASGSKCWLVGGFTGSFYNSGSSYIESPCFNIASLSLPEISFKIFWETERRYDGTNLEYTTDGGINWLLLGSINSNSTCEGSNWYNYNPINFLGAAGWSGNIQPNSGSCVGGGGSGGWLTARHSLSVAGGATSLRFRFVFAAGLTCNAFDGFAIDDLHIGEAAPNSAGFSYTCAANSSADFISSATGCVSSTSWNFGDAASGTANLSTVSNPSHIFSTAGSYDVTLTTVFANGPSITTIKNIKIISAVATITNNIKCYGDQTAAISLNVAPAGTYMYTWNTNPVQNTANISNLAAGTYTVNITGTNTCNVSLPVIITEPDELVLSATKKDASCNNNNGSVAVSSTGGTAPLNFTWSNGATTTSINQLAAGSYSLIVRDANLCTATVSNITIANKVNNLAVNLGPAQAICPNQVIVLKPGNFYTYLWQDNSTAPTYTVNMPGTYSVKVTDQDGCSATGSVIISGDCAEIYFPSAFTPNNDNRNDAFGALGTSLAAIRNYTLTVYGRWGEVLFSTNDPYKKWDGTYKGKAQGTGVYTWIANYSLSNFLPEMQKGSITIIR